jgi:putative sigma-54 modulation protein
MDLTIRAVGLDVSKEVRAAADRHASRIGRLVDRIVDAKLELRRHAQRTGGEITIAQVTLQTRRATLRAEERDFDPVKAVDRAMEKLERQVRRYHERKSDRFGRHVAPDDLGPAKTVTADADETEDGGEIVRTKRFQVKPMDPDEAIEQMELLGHDFFLFENTESKGVSLVYRRRDGSYGLLLPEPM